jgi:hypothetical protein
MDRLASMETFIRVVETGSFSGAARQLRVGQPAVSKTVAQLESYLGVKLLTRSTRRLTPTEAGLGYFGMATCRGPCRGLQPRSLLTSFPGSQRASACRDGIGWNMWTGRCRSSGSHCRSSTAWRWSPTALATVCCGTMRLSPNSSSIENIMAADGPLTTPERCKEKERLNRPKNGCPQVRKSLGS